ncbi:MAG: NADH-quinone oxidoreductase subunit NuoK [Bacteroidota bacterium]
MMSPAEIYLVLAAFLFCTGVFIVITRRNAVMALIGIELILNASNLNFVAFSQRSPDQFSGQMAALFIIVLAAAEVAVALAIVLNVYKRFKTVDMDEIDTLKE